MDHIIESKSDGAKFKLRLYVDEDKLVDFIISSQHHDAPFRRARRDGRARAQLCRGGVTFELELVKEEHG